MADIRSVMVRVSASLARRTSAGSSGRRKQRGTRKRGSSRYISTSGRTYQTETQLSSGARTLSVGEPLVEKWHRYIADDLGVPVEGVKGISGLGVYFSRPPRQRAVMDLDGRHHWPDLHWDGEAECYVDTGTMFAFFDECDYDGNTIGIYARELLLFDGVHGSVKNGEKYGHRLPLGGNQAVAARRSTGAGTAARLGDVERF